MVKAAPFNAEAPLAALDDPVTRIEDFYVRTNLGVPDIDPVVWRLVVDGLVERPLSLSLADLQAMPTRTVTCTIECAGNNRTRLEPITEGEPWGPGAISTGVFEGVPLDHILDAAGVRPAAVEVRFEGTDRGIPRGRTDAIAYERSLPVADAVGGDLLLAVRLNDAALTPEHGAPVRLIVPGWYGMASVKWLGRIDVLDHPLEAHYQTRQYRYYHDEPVGTIAAPPVRTMRVNSLVSSPRSGDVIGPGPHEIRGAAWSGDASIVAVDVSVDAGPWLPAELLGAALPYAWRRWRFAWPGAAAGRHSLRSRATAADGSMQPDRPDWNRLGYGNNAIAVTLITVADGG
jgi:DMSO/TMAO reductase YedYZ molybdopterin-dependent catalytic subunit